MYADKNFKTKKALKEAVAAYLAGEGPAVTIHSPGPFPAKTDGNETLEGPWYPEPHRWYAAVVMQDGKVIKVK